MLGTWDVNHGRQYVRWVARFALALALAIGVLALSGSTPGPSAAEIEAFRAVYVAAELSGRDPDAALRKAQFRTGILVRDLGMERSEAAAEVARSLILRIDRLCGG